MHTPNFPPLLHHAQYTLPTPQTLYTPCTNTLPLASCPASCRCHYPDSEGGTAPRAHSTPPPSLHSILLHSTSPHSTPYTAPSYTVLPYTAPPTQHPSTQHPPTQYPPTQHPLGATLG